MIEGTNKRWSQQTPKTKGENPYDTIAKEYAEPFPMTTRRNRKTGRAERLCVTRGPWSFAFMPDSIRYPRHLGLQRHWIPDL